MTHTTTPWRIGNAGTGIFGPPTGTPSPETVATELRNRANAQHIVHCVNTYPALVAALEECDQFFQEFYEVSEQAFGMWGPRHKQVKAALALARKEDA